MNKMQVLYWIVTCWKQEKTKNDEMRTRMEGREMEKEKKNMGKSRIDVECVHDEVFITNDFLDIFAPTPRALWGVGSLH